MARPTVIANISEFCYSSDVPIASLTADQGTSQDKQAAVGAIQVIVTDFGKVRLVANRLMPTMTDGNDCVYLLDPEYLSTSYLSPIQATIWPRLVCPTRRCWQQTGAYAATTSARRQ